MSKIGGGGGGSDDSFAREQARLAEERERLRQQRINEGLERIKRVFEGGMVATNPLDQFTVYDPDAQYYKHDATPWVMPSTGRTVVGHTPRSYEVIGKHWYTRGRDDEPAFRNVMGWVGGDPIYRNFTEQERLTNQALSETGLYGGAEHRGGFGDEFYNAYRDAYDQFYNPELERQRQEAIDQTRFALARTGQLRSSEAARQLADLERQGAEGSAIVKSQGDASTADLRNRVQAARENVTNQLYATEDPDVAATAALTRAQGLQDEEPIFSPLGQMFQLAATTASSLSRGREAAQLEQFLRSVGVPKSPWSSSGSTG